MRTRVARTVISAAAVAALLTACTSSGVEVVDADPAPTATAEPTADVEPADSATQPADEAAGDGAGPAGANTADEDVMDVSDLSDTECLRIGRSLPGILGLGVTSGFEEKLATFRSFAAGTPGGTPAEIENFLDTYEAGYRMLAEAGVDFGDIESMQAADVQDVIRATKELTETPELDAAIEAAEELLFEACPMLR